MIGWGLLPGTRGASPSWPRYEDFREQLKGDFAVLFGDWVFFGAVPGLSTLIMFSASTGFSEFNWLSIHGSCPISLDTVLESVRILVHLFKFQA